MGDRRSDVTLAYELGAEPAVLTEREAELLERGTARLEGALSEAQAELRAWRLRRDAMTC